MVDVADSKSAGGDTVWVRVPPPAPYFQNPAVVETAGFSCVFNAFRLLPVFILFNNYIYLNAIVMCFKRHFY